MKINVEKVKNIAGKLVNADVQSDPGSVIVEGDILYFAAPVSFSGNVENTGKTLVINGTVSTLAELECGRCAEKILYHVNAPFHEVYSNQPDIDVSEDEEIRQYEGYLIDIFPEAVQAIILELPMKILCREDCKGLCPACGVNLNVRECHCEAESVDPRLMALKKFLKVSSTEGGVMDGSTEKKNL